MRKQPLITVHSPLIPICYEEIQTRQLCLFSNSTALVSTSILFIILKQKYPRLTSWVCTPTLILVNRYQQFEFGEDMPIKCAVSIHRIISCVDQNKMVYAGFANHSRSLGSC